MDILLNITQNVKKNFEESLKKFGIKDFIPNKVINSLNNYIDVVKCIDNLSINYSIDLYIKIFEYLDNAFFNSIYRKQHCDVICIDKRTIISFWSELTFYRRRYKDNFSGKEYYFVDKLLSLDKYKVYDPFVCAKICEESSHSSYAKAGRTVSELMTLINILFLELLLEISL